MGGSGGKRAGKLLPALLKTQQELKLCSLEPAWWCTCTVELPAWQGILRELDILACYLCSLESLLESTPCLGICLLSEQWAWNLPGWTSWPAACAAWSSSRTVCPTSAVNMHLRVQAVQQAVARGGLGACLGCNIMCEPGPTWCSTSS